jgi:hypothetical protein
MTRTSASSTITKAGGACLAEARKRKADGACLAEARKRKADGACLAEARKRGGGNLLCTHP